MSKHINADELQYKVMKEIEEVEENSTMFDTVGIAFVAGAKRVLRLLEQMLPADVAEVKHGEWQEVERWECTTHSVTDMKCSVCHHYAEQVLPHQTTCTWDFCPNCGADMRKERNR